MMSLLMSLLMSLYSCLCGVFGFFHTEIGSGDGMDWSFEVFQMRNKILEFSFRSRSNHTVSGCGCVIMVPMRPKMDGMRHVVVYRARIECFPPTQQVIVPDAKDEAVRVVFLDSRPLLVTDDVRMKFYCSTVRMGRRGGRWVGEGGKRMERRERRVDRREGWGEGDGGEKRGRWWGEEGRGLKGG